MPENSLPLDWEQTDSTLRGVSRCERLGAYLAVIQLNKRQQHFGPFKVSRLEAANAYDRLTRYFLPFVKEKPVLNCPAETFLAFTDAKTEEMYGAARLQRLRARLTAELREVGVDLDAEASIRLDFITTTGPLKNAYLNTVVDKRRRRALIKLEAQSMRNSRTFELVEKVRDLTIPHDHFVPHIANQVVKTIAAYDAAQAELCTLISMSKRALDLNPDLSTK